MELLYVATTSTSLFRNFTDSQPILFYTAKFLNLSPFSVSYTPSTRAPSAQYVFPPEALRLQSFNCNN